MFMADQLTPPLVTATTLPQRLHIVKMRSSLALVRHLIRW
jgi:hypothetical protein